MYQVAAGDQLGTAARSACSSSSNHIHFAVYRNGSSVDPTRFLLPRKPKRPTWNQTCDEYKVVYKVEQYTIINYRMFLSTCVRNILSGKSE